LLPSGVITIAHPPSCAMTSYHICAISRLTRLAG
jgi:hypothetical protein